MLACLSMLCTGRAGAQAPGIAWQSIYQHIPATETGAVAEPAADGGYIVGAGSASHFWVFKLNGSGAQQWERYLATGTGLTTLYAIKQTTDNGYIAVGSDFVPSGTDSVGNHGIRDFFVVKLDNAGNVSWIKCLGGTLNEEASSVEQTADGGYIVAGFTSSSDGDVTGWHGSADYWVVKLDASGNISWQKTLGGSASDYAKSIVPTSDGGYIVAGYTGSRDGDATGTHWGGSDDDVWVVKLDATGNIAWQKSYGGSKEDQAYAIRQTSDGGYIVAGSTVSNDGNVTGKHGTSHDNQDYWVIRLDATGNLTWQKCLGGSGSGIGAGSGNDIAYAVRQTSDGGYIVAGTVSSGMASNNDITGYHGATGSDYWVVKLDASGNLGWQKCLGGSGTEDARSIAQTADGGYIVAGTSVFSNNGDVTSSDYGNSHPWIVKLGGTSGMQNEPSRSLIAVYPNPATTKVRLDNIPAGAAIRITDLSGRTICTFTSTTTTEIIPVDKFDNGLYMARVESSAGVSRVRFVVAR